MTVANRKSTSKIAEAIDLCALSQEEAAALFGVSKPTVQKWASEAIKTPDWALDRLADLWKEIEVGTDIDGLNSFQVARRSMLSELRDRASRSPSVTRTIAVPGGDVMTVEVSRVSTSLGRADCQVLLTCAGRSKSVRFSTEWDEETGKVRRNAEEEVRLFRRLNTSVSATRLMWVNGLRHVVPTFRKEERLETHLGDSLDAADILLGDVITLVACMVDETSKFKNDTPAELGKALVKAGIKGKS